MKTELKTKILILISAFAFGSVSFAQGLGCTLDGSKYGNFPPHTKVEEDLDGDGLKDLFYLAGEEDEFQTCIYISRKRKRESPLKVLKHEHSGAYDTALSFSGKRRPKFLVPERIGDGCGLSEGNDLIPEEMKGEIRALSLKWAEGFEKFNFTYGMLTEFPIMNLYLPNEVAVIEFRDGRKVDVSNETDVRPYFELKKKVVAAVLKKRALSDDCRAHLKTLLKAIPEPGNAGINPPL